jgi:hypothetical protein
MKQYGSKSRPNKAHQVPHAAKTCASSPTAIAKNKVINASPNKTIQRPPKRGRQILKEPKVVAISLISEDKEPCKNLTQGKIECFSNQCSLSVAKHSEIPANLIDARNMPLLSDIESTEAFHTRSDFSQKYKASFKPRLCTVPAVQQNDFAAANCCPQQSQIESKHITHTNCSNVQPIPVPNIFSMPHRATSRSELHLTSNQALLETRTIGIQVDLQPISDMKIMLTSLL